MSAAAYFFLIILPYFTVSTLGYVPVHERPVRPIPSRNGQQPIIAGNPRPNRGPFHNVPGPQRGSSTSDGVPSLVPSMLSGISRRLGVVEARYNMVSRNCERLRENMSPLVERIRNLETQVSDMSPPQTVSNLRSANVDLETRVSRLETENEELREFLVSFEQFFHRLMSADPAAYDPEAAPAERLSRLHQYLGNAEAELISLSSQRVTISQTSNNDDIEDDLQADGPQDPFDDVAPDGGPDQVFTVQLSSSHNRNSSVMTASRRGPSGIDKQVSSRREEERGSSTTSEMGTSGEGVHLSTAEADRLAVALEQLDSRNRELTSRLQTLEQKASDSKPVGAQTFGIASQETSNAITEELLNKVELLEQVVALQASSILEDTVQTGDRVGISSVAAKDEATGFKGRPGPQGLPGPGSMGTSTSSMNREDVEIMKEVLDEARSKGSSRKSAFSVARTIPLLGSDELQHIEFDHVFVNKGRDFVADNSTFICERPGYYFITFHLRSYDGHYLGVSLMKNGEVVTSVFTDADARNVMEGQSVIVHLEAGDNLYLLLGRSPDFGLHSSHRKYVTFSGFLIYSGY